MIGVGAIDVSRVVETYVKRMAAHKPNAHRLPREHLVLGKCRRLLLRVKPLWVFKDVPGLEIVSVSHGGQAIGY